MLCTCRISVSKFLLLQEAAGFYTSSLRINGQLKQCAFARLQNACPLTLNLRRHSQCVIYSQSVEIHRSFKKHSFKKNCNCSDSLSHKFVTKPPYFTLYTNVSMAFFTATNSCDTRTDMGEFLHIRKSPDPLGPV